MSAPQFDRELAMRQLEEAEARGARKEEMGKAIFERDRSVLIQADIRRQAARKTVELFPDASVEQAQRIAKDIEKKLREKSQNESLPTGSGRAPSGASQNEVSREMASALPIAGAIGGFMLGGPPGAVVGAGLGAFWQSGVNAATKDDPNQVIHPFRNARNAMAMEAAAPLIFDVTLGSVARLLRGDKKTAESIAKSMTRAGIEPTLQDVSTNPLVEGGRLVLGSFPMLARPFKRRQADAAVQFQGKVDDFISSVSPDTIIIKRMQESGRHVEAAALQEALETGTFEAMEKGTQALRKQVDDAFAEVKRFEGIEIGPRQKDLPVSSLQFRDALGTETVKTQAGIGKVANFIDSYRAGGAALPKDIAGVETFVQDITQNAVLGKMNFTELRKLKKRVSKEIELYSADSPDAVKALVMLKNGIEEDMLVAAHKSPGLGAAYDKAMAISEEYLTLLGQAVAKKGRKVQVGFGRQATQTVETEGGATLIKGAGTADISGMVDILTATKNPNEVRQFFDVMARGVGKEQARKAIGNALAKKIDTAFEATIRRSTEKAGDASFKPGALLDELGLGSPTDPKYKATVALFEAAGVPTGQVVDLAKTLDALFSIKNPVVSRFIQRKAVLQANRGIASGAMIGSFVGAGGASQGTIAPALMFFMIGRSYGKWVTDPRRARLVMRATDIRAPENVRAAAAISLLSDTTFVQEVLRSEENGIEDTERTAAIERLRRKDGRSSFFKELDSSTRMPSR